MAERDARPHTSPAPAARSAGSKPAGSLTFTERARLDSLPEQIAKLEAEIARLVVLLSDDTLFSREPQKFEKASRLLAERQDALARAEADWLSLEEKASA